MQTNSADPSSVEKCKAYKEAIQDWLDEVDGCDEVTEQQKQEAQDEIDLLDCN